MSPTDQAFLKAITTIKTSSRGPNASGKPPADRKVQLYGLYKQSTEGDVEGIMPRPDGTDPQGRANQQKWDAWKSREGMSKQEAKLQYVEYSLETIKMLTPESRASSQPWIELEEALKTAREQQPDTSTTGEPLTQWPLQPNSEASNNNIPSSTGHPYTHSRLGSRRLSVGSLNSSYSHFSRHPILDSPSVRNSGAYSEYGLSVKDRSESQADQIVDRSQSAYPSVIPGAVEPGPWPSAQDVEAAAPSIPPSPQYPFLNGSNHDDAPIPPNQPSLSEWSRVLFYAARSWASDAFERSLRRLMVDSAKLVVLLLVIRVISSRPAFLNRSPALQRILNTFGRVLVVVFDGFGIELRLKQPANTIHQK